MRITTANAFEGSINQLQRRQQALTEAQQQMTSGKRVQRGSDDPAAAARAERAMSAAARAESHQRALDTSRTAMQLTESALGHAADLMQQAREKVVAAGNGSYSDGERRILAEAVRSLRNDLLAVANRGDGAGRYLFGGQGSDGPPFVDGAGGVTYVGSAGEQTAASGEATPLTVDGQVAWMSTADPANPLQRVSVFKALDDIVNGLLRPGATSAQVAQVVATGLAAIDATAGTLSSSRARAGEALNRIDGIELRLSQTKLDAETERSRAEDLDMVEAISDVQNQQTGYQAALQMYSMVQRMSLFDYIK